MVGRLGGKETCAGVWRWYSLSIVQYMKQKAKESMHVQPSGGKE